jgi:hypothetical protein
LPLARAHETGELAIQAALEDDIRCVQGWAPRAIAESSVSGDAASTIPAQARKTQPSMLRG